MYGHEPKMSDARTQYGIGSIVVVEPIEEGCHFPLKPIRGRCFEMHALVTHRTRNNLHRPFGVIAPVANLDFSQTAVPCRE
jgi:hypothetical protein